MMKMRTLASVACLVVAAGCAARGRLPSAGAADRRLRVVVFGAHPDDPESGAGGLIALLTRAGHEVIVAYSTSFRGDRKVGDEPEGVVRQREAVESCGVLGATPKFFPYAHEKLDADEATVA